MVSCTAATLVPGAAVTTPLQVSLMSAGSATTIPGGKLSVNAKLLTKPSEFSVIVNVSVLRPPTGTLLGENPLVKLGSDPATVSVALAVVLSGADDVRTPLVFVPVAVATTLTVTVQLELPPTFPALKLIVVPPFAALTTPSVHVVDALDGVAITMLAGKVSLKVREVRGGGLDHP